MPRPKPKKPKPPLQKASSQAAVKTTKSGLPIAELRKRTSEKSSFTIGEPVHHPQFGKGAVIGIEDGTLTITFADRQVRRIVDSYVRRQKE